MRILLIGCDFGGWHTRDGDAIAVCKWTPGRAMHVSAQCGAFLFPNNQNIVLEHTQKASIKQKVIIAFDASLGWPDAFRALVARADKASHRFRLRTAGSSIENPYLYRRTEKFIKDQCFSSGKKKTPLTASGDKFGNNSSKAQALASVLKKAIPDLYRPPFDGWDVGVAHSAKVSLIEVYPDASMRSREFRHLEWPQPPPERMSAVGNSDIADAKRCAMTALCYAVSIGLVSKRAAVAIPRVYLPTDADSDSRKYLKKEGWIFSPVLTT